MFPAGLDDLRVPAMSIKASIDVYVPLCAVLVGGDQLVPHHDPVKRAHVKIWADHCTDRIQKAYYTALMGQDPSSQQVCFSCCPTVVHPCVL